VRKPCRLEMVAWDTTSQTEPVAISMKRAKSGRDERELPSAMLVMNRPGLGLKSPLDAMGSGRSGAVISPVQARYWLPTGLLLRYCSGTTLMWIGST